LYRTTDSDFLDFKLIVTHDPCAYCGEAATGADHIDAVSIGGENVWMNLTGACTKCNRTKHSKNLLTFLLADR
jgi:5-methylcytosine-specific restriction endonuclease McrA